MSHKQSKISGFFKTAPRLANGQTDLGATADSVTVAITTTHCQFFVFFYYYCRRRC
ncbi:hypothetical protein VDGD_21474 [Verticillium dahliae]|nr:hypothetical protein VDGD_21474 [Verticillium dahliae]